MHAHSRIPVKNCGDVVPQMIKPGRQHDICPRVGAIAERMAEGVDRNLAAWSHARPKTDAGLLMCFMKVEDTLAGIQT